MSVQSFITIKWQEKKLSMIKIFKFLFLTTLKFSLGSLEPGGLDPWEPRIFNVEKIEALRVLGLEIVTMTVLP